MDASSTLPPLYARWIQELLKAPIPEETQATCSDCAMCITKNIPRTQDDVLFHLKTKCCTYIPALPNYLVGKIFLDEDPASAQGRRAFEVYFETRADRKPQGVSPDHDFVIGYVPKAFGKEPELRCPYYLEEEGGLCGIWQHRNGRCATWFCKYVRGRVGLSFWQALDELLSSVEMSLSHWCMHKLEVGTEDFRKAFPWSGKPDSGTWLRQQIFHSRSSVLSVMGEHRSAFQSFLQEAWGKWLGREKEYYGECFRLVEPLAWRDVLSIGGDEIEELGAQATKAFAALQSRQIPESLRRNEIRAVDLNDDTVRIWAYARFDPADVPKFVLEILPYFDGRPTQEALQRIEAEKGIRVPIDLLQKLTDFGILK